MTQLNKVPPRITGVFGGRRLGFAQAAAADTAIR